MSAIFDVSLIIYNLCLLPVIFFSVLFILLAVINIFLKEEEKIWKTPKDLPFISVQVPTFNDPIAERCIKKCMEFVYPKDKYEIMIIDDSTNKETQNLLKKYETANPGFIKYIHRDNRHGFKPGALKSAMSKTKGEIIVIFDSDWIPKKDFLKEVVRPFSDPNVAIVQTKQGIYNHKTNLITRLAAYTLITYHEIMMPISNRINTVFFCGTAGAIRKKALIKVGGWNLNSITEDTDLSVRLLSYGYKSVYLNIETPSEVPDTFESYIKQQMRWCYGNTRVFLDNLPKLLFKKGLTFRQRLMISFLTLGNMIAPFVFIMTIFGFLGWFFGDPNLFKLSDLLTFFSKFFYTAGFLLMGMIALRKQKRLKELKYLIASIFTVGIILSAANSVAFVRALFNKKLHWYCTPKIDNNRIAVK